METDRKDLGQEPKTPETRSVPAPSKGPLYRAVDSCLRMVLGDGIQGLRTKLLERTRAILNLPEDGWDGLRVLVRRSILLLYNLSGLGLLLHILGFDLRPLDQPGGQAKHKGHKRKHTDLDTSDQEILVEEEMENKRWRPNGAYTAIHDFLRRMFGVRDPNENIESFIVPEEPGVMERSGGVEIIPPVVGQGFIFEFQSRVWNQTPDMNFVGLEAPKKDGEVQGQVGAISEKGGEAMRFGATPVKDRQVPEEDRETPRKVTAALEKVAAALEKIESTCEKIGETPEKIDTTQDNIGATLEKVETAPDKVKPDFEKKGEDLDKVTSAPEKVEAENESQRDETVLDQYQEPMGGGITTNGSQETTSQREGETSYKDVQETTTDAEENPSQEEVETPTTAAEKTLNLRDENPNLDPKHGPQGSSTPEPGESPSHGQEESPVEERTSNRGSDLNPGDETLNLKDDETSEGGFSAISGSTAYMSYNEETSQDYGSCDEAHEVTVSADCSLNEVSSTPRATSPISPRRTSI